MWTCTESLNDVLSLILLEARLESFVTCSFDLGGAWAIEFPRADALRFKFITRGECWLTVEGDGQSHRLHAGDCFLVSPGRSFVLSKDKVVSDTEQAAELALANRDSRIIVYNGGGDTVSIGAVFRFHGQFSKMIFDSLPPVIHIPAHLDQAFVLRWSLDRFAAEFYGTGMGRALMMSNLAPIILLQTLRIYLGSKNDKPSWLTALSHPKLSRAVEAIHTEYREKWTLETLAKVSGISRASFASKFKDFVGATPMEYLARWRMQVACDLLQHEGIGMSEVANRTGYESESSFSAAFNRIVGIRPGSYRKHKVQLTNQHDD